MAMRTDIRHFNSPEHMFRTIREARVRIDKSERAMDYCLRGASEREQAPVNAIMDALDDTVERERRELVAAPVGHRVVVPDVLRGHPMAMRRHAMEPSLLAPVSLVMEISVSGDMDEKAFMRRGAALAALALRLSETRPVECRLAWADMTMGRNGGYINTLGTVRLPSNPMDVGQLTALACDMRFQFDVTFAMDAVQAGYTNITQSPGIAWAYGMEPGDPRRIKKVRDHLGLLEGDLFIPGGYSTEARQMARDPVGWVNKYLDAQRLLQD